MVSAGCTHRHSIEALSTVSATGSCSKETKCLLKAPGTVNLLTLARTCTGSCCVSTARSKPHLQQAGVQVVGRGQAQHIDLHKLEAGQLASLHSSPGSSHDLQHAGCLARAWNPRDVQGLAPIPGPCLHSGLNILQQYVWGILATLEPQ